MIYIIDNFLTRKTFEIIKEGAKDFKEVDKYFIVTPIIFRFVFLVGYGCF